VLGVGALDRWFDKSHPLFSEGKINLSFFQLNISFYNTEPGCQ
jgi:hypothetical protein